MRLRRSAAGAVELLIEHLGLVFAGLGGGTTKCGSAPLSPRSGVHSAYATTLVRRLQLSLLVQRKSAKWHPGSPVRSALCSVHHAAAGRAIQPCKARAHDRPARRSSNGAGVQVRKTWTARPRRGERDGDVVDQPLITGEAEQVVDAVVFAPAKARRRSIRTLEGTGDPNPVGDRAGRP